MKQLVTALLLLCHGANPALSRVVVALLALYSGTNCTTVSPAGTTQLANLRSFIRELNAVDRQVTAKTGAAVLLITDVIGELPAVNTTLLVLELESTDTQVFGLNLLAAAGSIVRRNMTSEEWNGALRSTTAFRRGKRIYFGMEMPVFVYVRQPGDAKLRKVGNVTGEEVLLDADLHIAVTNSTSCQVVTSEHDMYLMVGMMTGVAVGLVTCLLCGLYLVHTAFKSSSDSNS
ncbi:hypothetical protein L9F63_021868 [Diploptera punctata]|uniref:PTS EIIA type-4 domain-containing protein n=1 Tax=Diploptera punctata TaxID=6984 RepID=A0AAD7ZQ10_DIPPU|nr:hypothetical protein L9F63_021868 [Diploptera punctata]